MKDDIAAAAVTLLFWLLLLLLLVANHGARQRAANHECFRIVTGVIPAPGWLAHARANPHPSGICRLAIRHVQGARNGH